MRVLHIIAILFVCHIASVLIAQATLHDDTQVVINRDGECGRSIEYPRPPSSLNLSINMTRDALEDYILDSMRINHIPGFSGSIWKKGEVIWTGALGVADFSVLPPRMVEESTLFILSSLTKTITATALMQLYDDGCFGLYDPINKYLKSFKVEHPTYPLTDITFHMLLTHTSSIKDNFSVMPYYQGDSPIPLGQYLEDYLTPGGAYYDPNANFISSDPGNSYSYSNIGIALAGYLVQEISNTKDLEEYCQQNLFPLLGMDETSYFLKYLDPDHIAMPYKWNGNSYVPYGHYGYSDYPSGQLRTSATQLMNFLSTFMQNRYPDGLPYSGGGQGGNSLGKMNGYNSPGSNVKIGNPPAKSTRILKADTVKMMLTPQIPSIKPDIGLVWNLSNYGGYAWVGLNGSDKGAATAMWYYQEEDIGIVGLINVESAFYDIFDAMFDYALDYE